MGTSSLSRNHKELASTCICVDRGRGSARQRDDSHGGQTHPLARSDWLIRVRSLTLNDVLSRRRIF